MASILWDKEVAGLGVRQNQRDAVWVLKYRIDGRQTIASLGPTSLIDVISARALARKMKWEGKRGLGPGPKERHLNLTVKDFCHEYIERHAKLKKARSWHKDQGRIDCYILPQLGKRKLRSITQQDIEALHASITRMGKKKAAPYAANRTVEQLRKMFKLAIGWGKLPKTFENPAVGIEMNRESSAIRFLSDSEITKLIPIIESLPIHKRVFFWLLLLTGSRYSEVLKLQWSDVDLPCKRLSIRETKNDSRHVVPIPKPILSLLKELPKDQNWVFPGKKGNHFKRMDKVWRSIRLKVGLGDVRIHDFRHTTATRLIRQGVHLRVVAELLNHKTLSSTMKYAHVFKDHLEGVVDANAVSIFELSNLTT